MKRRVDQPLGLFLTQTEPGHLQHFWQLDLRVLDLNESGFSGNRGTGHSVTHGIDDDSSNLKIESRHHPFLRFIFGRCGGGWMGGLYRFLCPERGYPKEQKARYLESVS